VRYYRLLAASLLGFMVIISLTGLVVEFSVNREGIQQLLWLAMIPVTAAALAALYTPFGAGRPQAVVGAYLVAMGAICVLHPRVRGDALLAETYGFSYPAFLLFLLLAFGRLAPPRALAAAGALIAAYALVQGNWLGAAVVANHVPLLLGAGALGFAVGYLAERNVRQLFAARAEVEDRERRLAESEARLRVERDKSEALLLSVLPESIAARLKAEGRSIADGIVECTVLFSDLVGFTTLAQELGPRALVDLLNRLFSVFDDLCPKHGLEKIKTIGDAYMAAAGVPEYRENHAPATADMALDMLASLRRFNAEHGTALSLRVGVHSGPVIAGIIGTRKFSYDLWGDAVNTAARMESHGLAGRIQVTEATAHLLRRTHELEERGMIEVKGKGAVRTFWLIGRRA
jgi:class 3 adenylate cyclase